MSTVAVPRWKLALDNAIARCSSHPPPYILSTASVVPAVLPNARHVIHRGFLTLRDQSHPLLLTTTDIRSQKVHQLARIPKVELAWWFPNTSEQFRIVCAAHLVPSPNRSDAVILDSSIAPGDFDWEAERQSRFNSLSPILRASFARPEPRSPIPSYDTAKSWPQSLPEIGEGKDDDENALILSASDNFALLVLDPDQVDYVELGIQPNQRTIFSLNERQQWIEQIVVP